MPSHLWILIVAFIVVDAVVVAVVLRRAMRTRGPGSVDLGTVMRFAKEAHQEAHDYFRLNYGGDPASLPRVMQGLLDRLDERAHADNLPFDRVLLKQIAIQSATMQHVADKRTIEAASQSIG